MADPGLDVRGGPDDDRRSASRATDVAVVSLVLQQMTLLEQRLGAKIDSVNAMTTERWRIHETEHSNIDKALEAFGHRLDDHLKRDEHDRIVFDARMGVLKKGWYYLLKEWRTVIILAFLLLDLSSQIVQTVQHFLHP